MTAPAHCRECLAPVDAGLYCPECRCRAPGCPRSARTAEGRFCSRHSRLSARHRVLVQVACERCGRPANIRSGMPRMCSRCRRAGAGVNPQPPMDEVSE
jgi:hypothetical protein